MELRDYRRPNYIVATDWYAEWECKDYDTVEKAKLGSKKHIMLVERDPLRYFSNSNVAKIQYWSNEDPSNVGYLDDAYQSYLNNLTYKEYEAKMRSFERQSLFKRPGDDWDHFYPLKKAWKNKVDFKYVLSVFNTHYINSSSNRQKSARLLLSTQEFYDFIYECHQAQCLGTEYAKQTNIIRDLCEGIFPPKSKRPIRY